MYSVIFLLISKPRGWNANDHIFKTRQENNSKFLYNHLSSLHAKSYFNPIVRKKFMMDFVHPTSTCLSEYNYSLVAVIHPISPDTDR